jgi:DNA-directed RNA polymerase subunit RPC12/RpoP
MPSCGAVLTFVVHICVLMVTDACRFKQISSDGSLEEQEVLSPSWTDKVATITSPLVSSLLSYRCIQCGVPSSFFTPLFSPSPPQSELPGTPSLGDGVLCDSTSRKTLYYLKATLNTAFSPDYDFRCVSCSSRVDASLFDLIRQWLRTS